MECDEIWLPVAGYEGWYEVSDRGHVRSLDRRVSSAANRMAPNGRSYVIRGRVLTSPPDKNGYPYQWLSRNGHRKQYAVHALVCTAFNGPRPEGQEVRHLNGQPTDNRASNLMWGTTRENSDDVKDHGRQWQINKTHCPRGHEYTEENTAIGRRGNGNRFRICRACRASWCKARYAARRRQIA